MQGCTIRIFSRSECLEGFNDFLGVFALYLPVEESLYGPDDSGAQLLSARAFRRFLLHSRSCNNQPDAQGAFLGTVALIQCWRIVRLPPPSRRAASSPPPSTAACVTRRLRAPTSISRPPIYIDSVQIWPRKMRARTFKREENIILVMTFKKISTTFTKENKTLSPAVAKIKIWYEGRSSSTDAGCCFEK